MLKLLLDENIGYLVVRDLRSQGYDVKSILEEKPSLDDVAVLKLAEKERRILVTLDKDFGKLIFLNSRKHVGVIFLRPQKESPANILALLTNVLKSYQNKLPNRFVTVSESNIRFRL